MWTYRSLDRRRRDHRDGGAGQLAVEHVQPRVR
nr:hypothetical protein [Novosphingobium nitrogenifigens]